MKRIIYNFAKLMFCEETKIGGEDKMKDILTIKVVEFDNNIGCTLQPKKRDKVKENGEAIAVCCTSILAGFCSNEQKSYKDVMSNIIIGMMKNLGEDSTKEILKRAEAIEYGKWETRR